MKWDELGRILLGRALDARLTVTRKRLRDGAVRAGRKPVDLRSIIDTEIESDGDVYDLEDGDVWRLLDDAGLCEPLLEFDWDGLGPCSSSAQIEVLHLSAQRWFATWRAEDEQLVIAAFDPLSPATARAFFADLLAKNGKTYGVGLFGSLPSRTINHRSDLIPAAVVEQCYWDWMQWISSEDASEWASLRDTVIGESEEPDHLRRSLQALKNLKGSGDAIKGYLAERQREGVEVSEDERRLILKNYFAVSYTERKVRKVRKR